MRHVTEKNDDRQQHAHDDMKQADAECAAGDFESIGMSFQPVDHSGLDRLRVGHDIRDELVTVAAEPQPSGAKNVGHLTHHRRKGVNVMLQEGD